MAFTIEKSFLTHNPCYRAGRSITPSGIMLHSVGTPQPNASAFLNSWNSPDYKSACVHAFIDAKTGIVYQTLPWTMRGWHCGSSANDTHIGVEMCEPNTIKYTGGSSFTIDAKNEAQARAMVDRTYKSAVELFAYLCTNFHLDPLKDGVVISHAEGHKRGIASNHGDPEHLWKRLGNGKTMDKFRIDVNSLMIGQNGSMEPSAVKTEEYKVRVNINNLNIRTGPGTRYKATGTTGVGVFTIVETNGTWGLLKSYAKNRNGWISLNYAKVVT